MKLRRLQRFEGGDMLAVGPWNEVDFGAVEKPGGGSPAMPI